MARHSQALVVIPMKFYRRWKRRFRDGLGQTQQLLAQCLRAGDPETVHDLRVTLRRTRLLALVGAPALGKDRSTRFRQWALKLSTTLGRARDYDVMLQWLEQHSIDARRAPALHKERSRVWRQTRPKLLALSRLQWNKSLQCESSAAKHRKLRKRFLKQVSKHRQVLRQTAAHFNSLNPSGRHEFRRILRRLRYLRELALRRPEQASDRRLKCLIAFQEALGEMQDCSIVDAFFKSRPSNLRKEVVTLAGVEEQKWARRAEKHLQAFLRQRG